MANLSSSLLEDIADCPPGEPCCGGWELRALELALGSLRGRPFRCPKELLARLEALSAASGAQMERTPSPDGEAAIVLLRGSGTGPLRRCCRGAVLRGAFRRGAYLGTEGHFEFTTRSEELARLLLRTRVPFQRVLRNGRHVLYLKDQEAIADTAGLMGAFRVMLKLEDLLVTRRMRNDINRVVNCELGNLARVSRSSVSVLEDIRLLTSRDGLDALPERLRQAAALKLRHPTASLRELAGRTRPGLTKSGMQHRIEELSRLAAEVRRQQT